MATTTPERKRVRIPLTNLALRSRDFNSQQSMESFDQYYINCFPEPFNAPYGSDGIQYARMLMVPQSDLSPSVSTSYEGTHGVCLWSGKPYTSSDSVSETYQGSARLVGIFTATAGFPNEVWDILDGSQIGSDFNMLGTGRYLTETFVGNTPYLFCNSTGSSSEAWYYPDGGAWTQVTDSDFPSNLVGPAVHMDGYVFIMTEDGKIYNSDLNSVSSWGSTNFISTQSYPDRGIGIARHKDGIAAFGRGTIEFFENVGNANGSPLQLIKAKTIQIGTLPYNDLPTFFSFGDEIYFIGTERNVGGQSGVYRLRDYKVEKISTATLSHVSIGNVTGIRGILGSASFGGMNHIVFYRQDSLNNDYYPCYCIETNVWWYLKLNSFWTPTPIKASISLLSETFMFSEDMGDTTIPDDASIVIGPQDFGTNKRKIFHSLDIIGDKILAVISADDLTLDISWSDTFEVETGSFPTRFSPVFTTARTIKMNTDYRRITGLGQSRRRAFKLDFPTNTAGTPLIPWNIEAIEICYSECAS